MIFVLITFVENYFFYLLQFSRIIFHTASSPVKINLRKSV